MPISQIIFPLWFCLFAVAVANIASGNEVSSSPGMPMRCINQVIGEKLIGKTKVVLLTGDLLSEETDAVVNAANAQLVPGGGICGAILKYAGPEVFVECQSILHLQQLPSLNPGEAALTTSGLLSPSIDVIVHAVGPDCRVADQNNNRDQLLRNAYTNSLGIVTHPTAFQKDISTLVKDQSFRTIAFPSISTGIYRFPVKEAAPVALQAVKDFIVANPDALDEVHFVFWPLTRDPNTAPAYLKALEDLD